VVCVGGGGGLHGAPRAPPPRPNEPLLPVKDEVLSVHSGAAGIGVDDAVLVGVYGLESEHRKDEDGHCHVVVRFSPPRQTFGRGSVTVPCEHGVAHGLLSAVQRCEGAAWLLPRQ
jgi:hypothetical protein